MIAHAEENEIPSTTSWNADDAARPLFSTEHNALSSSSFFFILFFYFPAARTRKAEKGTDRSLPFSRSSTHPLLRFVSAFIIIRAG